MKRKQTNKQLFFYLNLLLLRDGEMIRNYYNNLGEMRVSNSEPMGGNPTPIR